MAPMKRPRESASKKNDKLKRRKRVAETDTLYKCLGKLCGEECQQDLATVRSAEPPRRESHSVPKRDRRDNRHDPLRDAMTDHSDEEYDDDGPNQDRVGTRHTGRVNKSSKIKKAASSASNAELPFKKGVQKAKRWLCAALDFGVQSEYLRLEDSKGKVLRVASELLQVGEDGTGTNKPRTLQRIGEEPPRNLQQRKRRRDETEEQRDDDDVAERSRRRSRRHRSRSSRRSKKRGGRSRSRSKRRHGKRRAIRSRSENPEGETRPQAGGTEGAEQDDMDCKETNTSSENRRDDNNSQNEDDKSVKSLKSTQNSESQNTVEEKKNADDDGSNDEDEDDDDDGKKK